MDGKLVWQRRERTLENGTVVRWRERDIGNGEVERIYDQDGPFRSSLPQPVALRDS